MKPSTVSDGRGDRGDSAARGVYFVRLSTPGEVAQVALILLGR